jgi:hypothetical protein
MVLLKRIAERMKKLSDGITLRININRQAITLRSVGNIAA